MEVRWVMGSLIDLMRRGFLAAALLLGLSGLAQPLTWSPAGSLARGRQGHTSTLLIDGYVVVAGGQGDAGLLDSVEIFNLTTLQASPGGTLNRPRSGHTATLLPDGRILLVGGHDEDGLCAMAEVFDPVAATSRDVPMLHPREHHSATLLQDGRVLVAGGRDAAGAVVTVEVFDPSSLAFQEAGILGTGRVDAAAVRARDGRVLISGGETPDGVLASTEWWSPADQACMAGPAMRIPRSAHTATLLDSGQIVLVGGSDGLHCLGSAEACDAGGGPFSITPGSLRTPRQHHAAILLPGNGAILVVGGDSEDGPTAAVEYLDPVTFAFLPAGPMGLARSGMGLVAFQASAYALGGSVPGPSSGQEVEALPFPDVLTSRLDYVPGNQVTAQGHNWRPQEQVNLAITRSDGVQVANLDVPTDDQGCFQVMAYDVTESDRGMAFTIQASGRASGWVARNRFTDGVSVTSMTPGTLMGGIAGQQLTFTGTGFTSNLFLLGAPSIYFLMTDPVDQIPYGSYSVVSDTQIICTVRPKVYNVAGNYSVAIVTPPSAFNSGTLWSGYMPLTVVKSNATLTLVPSSLSGSWTGLPKAAQATTNPSGLSGVTIKYKIHGYEPSTYTTTAFSNAGTYDVLATLDNPAWTAADVTGLLTISGTATATQLNASTTTLVTGSQVNLVATVTPAATGKVTFLDGGSTVLGTVDLNNGTATLSTSSLGPGSHTLTAFYGGGGSLAYSSSSPVTVTVLKTSTTTLSPSTTTPYAGQQVTLTAIVTSGASGQVQFMDGTEILAGSPVRLAVDPADNKTKASITTTLSEGSHTIQASYLGDAAYAPSASPLVIWFFKKASLTTLTIDPPVPISGSPITLTAVVARGATGQVTFSDGAITLGVASLWLDPADNKTKTKLTTTLSPGNHSLGASYAGDSVYGPSEATMAATVYLDSTTTLTLNPSFPTAGQSVKLTAVVTRFATGTVQFMDGATLIGSPVSLAVDPMDGLPKATSTTTLNPGTHSLKASYLGDSHYAPSDSAINALTVKIPASLVLDSLSTTYDGTSHAATATVYAGGVPVNADGVSIVYKPAGGTTYASTAPVAAGTYDVKASLNNPTYTAADVTGTLTIDKAAATLVLGSLTATYGGNAHAATVTTTPSGLAVSFTYDGSSTVPVNAGSYAVVATVTDPNYTGTSNGTLKINKAAASLVLGSLSATYDGSAHAATVTTTPSGLAVSFSYDGSSTVPSNAGSYAVVATATDPNYTGTASGTLKIDKAAASLVLGSLSATYDGSAHAATVATTPSGLAVSFTYDGSSTVPSNAGSYVVVATLTDPNYSGTASGTLKIDKAAATLVLGSLTATYDGNAHAATVNTTPSGLAVSITYDESATAPVNAGIYVVVATLTDANYSGTATGTLMIAKAVSVLSLGDLTATYNGLAHAVSVTTLPAGLAPRVSFAYGGSATAPVNAGSYAVVATLTDPNYIGTASGTLTIDKAAASLVLGSLSATYDGSAHAATVTTSPSGLAVSFTYDGSSMVPSNAGSYAVVATVTDSNYIGTASGTLKINKAAASLVLGALSATYDGSAHAATVTTTPSGLTANFTYDGSSTVPANAGNYAVVATLTDPNYTGTASGTLTIGRAAASLILGALSATYDGSAHAATVTTTPPGLAVSFTYDGSATAPVNAGSYAVVAALNDSNYSGSASGTLKIDKAAATLILGSLTATYDGDPHGVAVTTLPAGLPGVQVSYNGSSTVPTAAGTYAVTAILVNPNYTAAPATATLAIAAQQVTVAVAADARSKVYGTPDPALTYQVTGGTLPASVSFTGTLARNPGETVGTYAITQGSLSLGPNYRIAFTGANLAITPRPVTVTAQPASKLLGAPDPAFTYAVTGGSLVGADGFTGSLGRVAGEAAGTYALTQGTLALGANYALTFKSANLSILYGCTGLLAPYSPTRTFNFRRTIPLKWQFTDHQGRPVPSATANPLLDLSKVSTGVASADLILLDDDECSAYRYDPVSATWQFNWEPEDLRGGTYYLYIKVGATGQVFGPFRISITR